jgi:hypothetical protein
MAAGPPLVSLLIKTGSLRHVGQLLKRSQLFFFVDFAFVLATFFVVSKLEPAQHQ